MISPRLRCLPSIARIALPILLLSAAGCARRSPESADAATVATTVAAPTAIAKFRAEKDAFMRDSPQSPFKAEPPVPFAPLKYFPSDSSWVFQSRLSLYPEMKPVVILDTKGSRRDGVLFGYLEFTRDGAVRKLNVYRMTGPIRGIYHYAIWFTDRTTGDSTYEVGRYLDFQKDEDPAHVYTIDFNLAYNPYCAYSPAYACPIPRVEDRLELAVTAGEKKWHEDGSKK
jgi:uncharacterized protein (DUF1684 family)